jgi:hypothetical protein
MTKEGEERLIFWHDVPVEDETGKRIGVISSGEDITENRRMEAMMVESEKTLKQCSTMLMTLSTFAFHAETS